MGCRFCASTLDGMEPDLRPSEMLTRFTASDYSAGSGVQYRSHGFRRTDG